MSTPPALQASWSNDNGGKRPRQPWADIHCRIHGPAAGAVVDNFVERRDPLPL